MEKYSLSVLWFCSSFLAFSNPKDLTSSTTKSMTLFFHYLHQIFGPGPKLAFFFSFPHNSYRQNRRNNNLLTGNTNLQSYESWEHHTQICCKLSAVLFATYTFSCLRFLYNHNNNFSFWRQVFLQIVMSFNHWVSPSLSSNNKEHNECIKSQKGIL